MKLWISKEVSSGTEEAETYTPPNGTLLEVKAFEGSGAFNPNAAVKLVWKWNHATEDEVVIWTIKGDQPMPDHYYIDDCDGIKKIAIVLDNGLDGSLLLSGYAYLVET